MFNAGLLTCWSEVAENMNETSWRFLLSHDDDVGGARFGIIVVF